jgi:hypothetical protein
MMSPYLKSYIIVFVPGSKRTYHIQLMKDLSAVRIVDLENGNEEVTPLRLPVSTNDTSAKTVEPGLEVAQTCFHEER